MPDVLIDDHLLMDVLLNAEPPGLRPRGAHLWTTGLWYHRLCRALAVPAVEGSLSSKLGDVPAELARVALSAVVELPDEIGLVSLRSLAWPMAAALADGVRLNLLSLEALAAAEQLGAEVCIAAADANAPLRAAAHARGVTVRTVD